MESTYDSKIEKLIEDYETHLEEIHVEGEDFYTEDLIVSVFDLLDSNDDFDRALEYMKKRPDMLRLYSVEPKWEYVHEYHEDLIESSEYAALEDIVRHDISRAS